MNALLPKHLELDVVWDDIKHGVPCNANRCMASRSAHRDLRQKRGIEPSRVRTTAAGMLITVGDKVFVYRLPNPTAKRIARYDTPEGKEEAKPFKLHLMLADIRKINKVPAERKAQINAARSARYHAAKEAGTLPPKQSGRHLGL